MHTSDVLDPERFWNEELMRANTDRLFGCYIFRRARASASIRSDTDSFPSARRSDAQCDDQRAHDEPRVQHHQVRRAQRPALRAHPQSVGTVRACRCCSLSRAI